MSNAKDPFIEVPAGVAVFKEGDVGAELYIIESGQVELAQRPGIALATLGPGDFLGEMALLENQPHTATALAKSKTRLLRIEIAMLADVLRQNGEIGLSLLRQIVVRQMHGEQRARDLGVELARFKAATKPEPAQVTALAPEPAQAPVTPATGSATPAPVAAPVQLGLRLAATGQTIALDPARSEFLVGRPDPVSGTTPEIDLGPFDANRTLSRRHAKILRDGTQYFVREDSATTNGTYLNGERLQTGVAVPVKSGDKLRFGSIEVEMVAG